MCRIRNYYSCNPYEIAASEGITVFHSELGHNIYGFSHTYKRQQMIVINKSLPSKVAKFVCAHELGHQMLHPTNNLTPHILFSDHKVDREIARFIIQILVRNKLYSYIPKHNVLSPVYV